MFGKFTLSKRTHHQSSPPRRRLRRRRQNMSHLHKEQSGQAVRASFFCFCFCVFPSQHEFQPANQPSTPSHCIALHCIALRRITRPCGGWVRHLGCTSINSFLRSGVGVAVRFTGLPCTVKCRCFSPVLSWRVRSSHGRIVDQQ
jgi:hypothetical protein